MIDFYRRTFLIHFISINEEYEDVACKVHPTFIVLFVHSINSFPSFKCRNLFILHPLVNHWNFEFLYRLAEPVPFIYFSPTHAQWRAQITQRDVTADVSTGTRRVWRHQTSISRAMHVESGWPSPPRNEEKTWDDRVFCRRAWAKMGFGLQVWV